MTDERYPFRAGLWECPNGHQEVAEEFLRAVRSNCGRCEEPLMRIRVVTLYGRIPKNDNRQAIVNQRQEARRHRQNRMAIRREQGLL